jgi:hypothetical protein
MIKKFLRLLIKLPATPFVVFFYLGVLMTGHLVRAGEWLYESSEFDKQITREIIEDHRRSLKRWFTTI